MSLEKAMDILTSTDDDTDIPRPKKKTDKALKVT